MTVSMSLQQACTIWSTGSVCYAYISKFALQGSMIHERLLPLAVRCLRLDSARVRQAAAQAIVAIMRQASSPTQQVQLCRRLCHISTHASASVSSISFIEGCRCMMHGFTTRYTAYLPALSAVCCLLDSCLLCAACLVAVCCVLPAW